MSSINIENRKAYFDYYILDTLECGIALRGHEIKSIRKGSCSLKDSYIDIQNNELILIDTHIAKYDKAMYYDVAERRNRKLLAHKQEIRTLKRKLIDKGITLIPLKLYMINGKVKILLGVCKGKHTYDKRQSLKEKVIKRDIERQ